MQRKHRDSTLPSPTEARCPAAPTDQAGFDFTSQMRALCEDLVTRLPELSHIDLDRVAVSFCQTRKRVPHGYQATLTPMRFEGGSLTTVRGGRRYTAERLYDRSGSEMLYILSFYLPRLLDLDSNEKLVTILHELWHIGPEFDGDLRRYGGRCYAHTHSEKQYDAHMQHLADRWLALAPPAQGCPLLRFNFRELRQRFGRVFGEKIPHPKLILVE